MSLPLETETEMGRVGKANVEEMPGLGTVGPRSFRRVAGLRGSYRATSLTNLSVGGLY